MIIKSTRIRAESGPKAVATHVLRGKDNERVTRLSGAEPLLADAVADARAWQRRYALRHFSVNPDAPLERREAVAVFQALAEEFGFDLERCLIVEHNKPRARDTGFGRHWHLLVPEVDPLTGHVLSSSHSYLRQEKIARRAELSFGHRLTRGRHNTAVVAALEAEGHPHPAQCLVEAGLTGGALAQAAYTTDQHQAAKRQGISLPEARAAVKVAWAASDSAETLKAALSEQSLAIAPGDKPGTWIITHSNGRILGALHRFAGVRKAAVSQRMKAGIYENRRATDVPPPKPQTRPAEGVLAHPLVGTAIGSRRQAEAVAARWHRLGCQAKARDTHVLVKGQDWRIADYGNQCILERAHPEAIALALAKARREWGGAVLASGSQAFLELAWLEAQRQDIRFSIKGEPDWQPPPHLLGQWRQEQEAAQQPPREPDPPQAASNQPKSGL
ncbi:LPD7 domain-containing protein [Aquibaculum arenosum]|uniref:Relaxase n=1 Tax=Aquibaculum arenosum TaxID=3032591 RepID=A0ABT5YJC4_9PROT|nr:LPD7 domain-containing protein [Fodinicurvata sp. CAU 1616]MDF2094953.1 hypothetical protein [Fodinicurvata sp. CAU 1616]